MVNNLAPNVELQNSTAIIDILTKNSYQLDGAQKGDHIFSLKSSGRSKQSNGSSGVMIVYPTQMVKVSFDI